MRSPGSMSNVNRILPFMAAGLRRRIAKERRSSWDDHDCRGRSQKGQPQVSNKWLKFTQGPRTAGGLAKLRQGEGQCLIR